MPGKIKVKVLAGRNLPVMDRAGDTTDAFVEIKFGGVTHKTDVCRKSLNPHWSSTEWYRFEVDESELQDEPLQLRLMDHDTYSANDAIGKVVISLAPLLAKEANNIRAPGQPGGAVMSGWIPVFDTMHGIRGELNIIVKVDLFTDFNKYKTSSCGVQFFHCHLIPHGYRAISIHGFVEELVVNDDPEYQWIDKIRTPRASNEARQVAFIKLSNQVQRLIGVKAAELGANAVVGYQQDFDLEGEAGVVARAIGTAVTLAPLSSQCQPINLPSCTQQQLRQCLDILATDGESITDLNQYFQNHQEELKKLLIIMNPKTPSLFDDPENADDDEKGFDLVRQPSCKSYADSVSIYQGDYESQKSLRHISEDQTDLNKLLKGDGNDSDSDSTSPMHKIKKIKTNFFSKKFGSNRSRKSEKQEDQVSIRSNSSDTSRLSLTDIKKEIIKFKRLKKPKFRQTFANIEDEGVGMASILARSVIHAHTSLACIAESQDSEHSPCSTMRRTSESEPTINMSDDDTGDSGQVPVVASKTETKQKTKPLQLHSSLKNIINNEVSSARRRLSQSCPSSPVTNRSKKFLTLPSGPGYFGSLSISAESSVYSSSDEDESSDQKTDTEKSIETTSIVVRSVLSGGVNHDVAASQMNTNLSKLENEKSDFKVVDPGVACLNYENDTCILENRTSDFREIDPRVNHVSDVDTSDSSSTPDHTENKRALQNTDKSSDTYVNTKPNHTLRFKLHNPFSHKKTSKCFSAPSSPIENTGFVYRSSKHIKHQLSKISNSNMIKSLSHYSLMPKKKQSEPKVALSQPGSSSNVPSRVPSETVLGSPFLSLADLQGLDKDDSIAYPPIHKNDFSEISRVKMYIGSEPVSRASISGPSFSRRISRDDSHIHEFNTLKRDRPEIKPVGLIHTAMETILMDKVQSLLVPTSPVTANNKDKKFFDDVHKKLEGVEEARKIHHIEQIKKFTTEGQKHETAAPENLLLLIKPPNNTKSTAMITENFQSLTSPRTSNTVVASERSHKCTPEHLQHCEPAMESLTSKNSTADSLINTAMKTILMDKIQALVPDSEHTETPVTEIIEISNNQSNNDIVNVSLTSKHGETESLVQTAMKTMLVDKAQALLPKCSDQMKIPVSYASDLTSQIIDSAQSKNIPPTELTNKPSNNDFDTISFTSPRSKSENLVETAMMALLIDKAQTIIPTATGQTDLPVLPELANASSPHAGDSNEDSLLYSAMETILLDKVNSMIPPTLSLKKDNKLVRQDSIHSLDGQDKDMLPDVSMNPEANIVIPCKKNHPVLQHFHPILSGAPLETIPSLPENSFEHTESLDVEGVDESSNIQLELETNSASVCDNSHAACRFDRSVVSYERSDRDRESPQHTRHESYGGREPLNPTLQQLHGGSVSSSAPVGMQRRSSDSDLSVTPKGGSLNASLNTGSGGGIFRGSLNKSNLEMLEYPFLTMTEYPHGFIKHIGGTVCARSVKLLDVGGESETRAAWWAELRTELRSHARALRCNAVIAYSEGAAICEDVCVLSAIGTAALINIDFEFSEEGDTNAGSDSEDGISASESETPDKGSKTTLDESEENSCLLAHVPYTPGTGPQSAELSTCAGCKRARVPAMLLATCVKPDQLPSYDRAINLTAVAARIRRAPPNSEPGARDISDQLPFLEYELHKLLVAKLRVQGANALFSLQTQLAIGERYVMALASGTAVKLFHLPPPTPPRVKISHNDRDTLEIQKALWDAFAANKAANGYDIAMTLPDPPANGSIIEQHELEELPVLDLCIDKDACTLDLDEAEEVESAKALTIRRTLMQVYTNDSKPAPNSPPHAFSQVWRSRLVVSSPGSGGAASAADRHVTRVMDGVVYKLRRLQPCGIVPPKLHIELPEDEIQIIVSGTAIRLDESSGAQHSAPVSEHSHETSAHSHTNSCHSNHHSSSVTTAPSSHSRSESSGESHSDSRSINQSMGGQELHRTNSGDADDDIFALDEDQCTHSAAHSHANETYDDRNIHAQIPAVVILTSLPSVNGARGSRRLCALRLLFVRETTAVRELGGVSGFLHTFTCEVLAIARAYTAALGGNAISSFYINQLILQDNAHKNQGQCLLSVGGDVEQVSF